MSVCLEFRVWRAVPEDPPQCTSLFRLLKAYLSHPDRANRWFSKMALLSMLGLNNDEQKLLYIASWKWHGDTSPIMQVTEYKDLPDQTMLSFQEMPSASIYISYKDSALISQDPVRYPPLVTVPRPIPITTASAWSVLPDLNSRTRSWDFYLPIKAYLRHPSRSNTCIYLEEILRDLNLVTTRDRLFAMGCLRYWTGSGLPLAEGDSLPTHRVLFSLHSESAYRCIFKYVSETQIFSNCV